MTKKDFFLRDILPLVAFTAVGVVLAAWLDVNEWFQEATRSLEAHEVDDIILFLSLFLLIGLAWIYRGRARDWRTEADKRRRAEKALVENEARFHQMAEVMGQVFWLVDATERRVLYVSPAFEKIWGLRCESLYEDPQAWVKAVVADDRPHVEARLAKSRLKGDDLEYRIARPDGSVRWIRTRSYAVYDDSGKLHRIVGSSEDITARKTAEEARQRLASLLENSSEFISMASLEGKVFYINEAGRRLVGLRDDEDVSATTIFDYLTEIGQSLAREILLPQVMAEGSWHGDGRLRHFVSGEPIDVHIALFVVRRPDGDEPMCLATVMRDVTERKRAEAALVAAKERAEAADRAKSAFLANMSHELKTPLNQIIGLTDLLQDDEENVERREFLGAIHQSALSLLDMIKVVLKLSEMETPRPKEPAEPFDLKVVIQKVAASASARAQDKGLDLDVLMEGRLPSPIVGDGKRLEQVLRRIIDNALKFTQQGRISIVASLRLEDEASSVILFSVTDTGIGIPSDKLDLIFEPFFQVDSSLTRRFSGAGLGLTLAKRLVEGMDGRIWVESRESKGSTVHFEVPFRK